MAGAIFPWREGNHFELLIDGPQFFPRMLVAIARAEEQVELVMLRKCLLPKSLTS